MPVRTRLALVLLVLAVSSPAASAQAAASTGPPGRHKFFVGGGVGLGFGDVDWVEISPLVGYRPVPQCDVGLGLTYRWSNYDGYGRDLSTDDDGFTLFADYYIRHGLFARGEHGYLAWDEPMDNGDSDRNGDNALELGGGYVVPIGQAAGLYVTPLYNFNYDENSPSGDALEHGIGVSFGF